MSMCAHVLFVVLLAVPFIPLLNAQQLLRVQAPAVTAAPLFMRQIFTCPVGQSSCTDGSGGCCDIGFPCAIQNGIPICQEDCGLGPTCTGILDGLCCNIGYTCDYQSTLCISSSLELSPPTQTPPSVSAIPVTPTPPTPTPIASATPIISVATNTLTSSTSIASSQDQTPSSLAIPPSTLATPITPVNTTTSTTAPTSTTTSTSSTSSTSTATSTTSQVVQASSGQDKLGHSLKAFLASYLMVLLWGQ